jgi:hypothetical protein
MINPIHPNQTGNMPIPEPPVTAAKDEVKVKNSAFDNVVEQVAGTGQPPKNAGTEPGEKVKVQVKNGQDSAPPPVVAHPKGGTLNITL